MSRSRKILGFASYSFLVGSLAVIGSSVIADDAVTAAGDQYQIEFENEKVRILRGTYAPSATAPMHEHPEGVVVQVTGGTLRFTTPDGEAGDAEVIAGNAGWSEAQMHEVQNVGDEELVVLIIELKD